ncbi:restriction endonuclease subunit S [Vibrio parahaemolyticus]|nr:restriction endonuclease subunit S [Vibrio parahaemolyticus]EJG0993787.1 restriction endonuclease subunit S [Vibrio parahaemolyticus]EJG1002638.1 restriction endonuclease subunit S [Vibrio parahaemolyticus]EJG1051644.1 restriction endonuclease subunit S [Vibrio parahaemolyticus]
MAVENLITEHIDIWTSSIQNKSSAGRGSSRKLDLYGIKKLRELILELAVRGKLVPQDPSDEPVSVLLERIAAEKAKLVKEKKIKKLKALPIIEECEKPFSLPQGWEWVRLGEVGNIFNGNSVSARVKEQKYMSSEGLPFIATKDVGYGFDGFDYLNGVHIPIGEPKFKIAKKNAVLICAEGGSAGKKCGIAEHDICFGNKLFANELYGNIHPKFILSNYLTPYFYAQFSKSMTGIIGGIAASKFVELLVPLPSIHEQHRIVAKVDELMALCDQLEQQTEASIEAHQVLVTTLLDTLTNSADADELMQNWARISEHFDTLFTTEESIDQLKQTILQLAVMGKLIHFGADPMETYVMDVISFGPRNGLSPKEVQVDTGIKVLKLGATSYGSLNLDESKSVDVDIEKTSHLWLKKGDILIQRGNSANYVGCNCLVKEDVCDVIYPDLMMKIRPSKTVSSEFLSTWLSSPMAREFMWTRMTGTSGTMPKISKKVVEAIPIIVPSRKIQDIIVSKVEELFSICDLLKQLISETQQTQSQLTDTIVEQAI